MRSQQIGLTLNPIKVVDAADYTKVFMCRNRSVSDTIFVQFGQSPGMPADAWPIMAGDVFVLDPAAPKESIWLWSTAAGVANSTIIG